MCYRWKHAQFLLHKLWTLAEEDLHKFLRKKNHFKSLKKGYFFEYLTDKNYPKYPTRVWSGIEVGFGRVRVYPKFEMSGSGTSGIDKLGFGRVRV